MFKEHCNVYPLREDLSKSWLQPKILIHKENDIITKSCLISYTIKDFKILRNMHHACTSMSIQVIHRRKNIKHINSENACHCFTISLCFSHIIWNIHNEKERKIARITSTTLILCFHNNYNIRSNLFFFMCYLHYNTWSSKVPMSILYVYMYLYPRVMVDKLLSISTTV